MKFPINDYIIDWEFETMYLKIIVTTNDDLDTEIFEQEGLPHPTYRSSKGLVRSEDNLEYTHDWVTRVIRIDLVSPAYTEES